MKKITIIIALITYNWAVAQNQITEINQFLQKASSAQQYIIEKFKTNNVVLLGEQHVVQQNLLFVQSMVPLLYKNGISNIGMEFGAAENQLLMDSLVTAPQFNDSLAAKMMFDYNVTWAFKEYIEVAKAAWLFNKSLPKLAKPFRIINLSYIFNWQDYPGYRDATTMNKVFYKGTVDAFRANIIEKEVLAKKEKIMALVGTPHAFTKYASSYFLFNGDNFCGFDNDWLGNRLHKKYPGKICNIMIHQGFMQKIGNQYKTVSPLNGLLETLILQNNHRSIGFNLGNSPVGKLKDSSLYANCYTNFTIGQLFDGYIFLQPLKALKGCTVVNNFVHEGNAKRALEQFPDPEWHPKMTNLADIQSFITKNAIYIEEMYKALP